jgi:AcrR family transcriptional regulator
MNVGKWSKKGSYEFSRCVPTQQRSRERYRSILDNAMKIIAEKGVDGLRMSDIVERANVPCGSLYQYFPDKAAVIGTLAEQLLAEGHDCVKAELSPIQTMEDLHPALCRITDGYYRVLLDEPVKRDIWYATQTDRTLQNLDKENMDVLSGYLLEVLQQLTTHSDPQALREFSRLTIQLIAAAVRHAITLEREEGDRAIALFKKLLPVDLKAIGDG